MAPAFVITTAFTALLALTEIAWWEGVWVDEFMRCDATAGDARPIRLSRDRLAFVEAECRPRSERAAARSLLIRASCRDHGGPRWRNRMIVLTPGNGGREMTMRMGMAEWRLRKC